MDSDNDFAQWMALEKTLITANRPLRLRLAYAQGINDDVLLPQRIHGTETLCGGIEYRILCVATDAQLPLKQFIAVPTELQIVTDRGALRSVCGIVAEACAGQSDGGLATYQLVLRDALALMDKRINTRVFLDKNELQIVQLLFEEWRQGNGILAASLALDIEPALAARQHPPREFTMQHNESDAAFIRRLLRRRGIAWCICPGQPDTPGAQGDDFPAHTVLLFDDASRLAQNAAGLVRYHRDDATEQRDTVTAWNAVRRLQPGTLERHSWDEAHPLNPQFMHTHSYGMAQQGANGQQLAATLDDYIVQMPQAGAGSDDHARLGELAMARHDLETKCFEGEGCVRDFCAGQWFSLQGHAEIDRHAVDQRSFVITSLTVLASNNLPKGLDARIDRLFAQSHWAIDASLAPPADGMTLRYRNRFSCVRRGVAIVPAFDPRSDLPVVRLQSALVVGPANEEVHCDALGRVKLRFVATRAQDHAHSNGSGASNTERDSAWVRVASSWAGNGPGIGRQCGAVSLPRIGSEVLVDFLGGDPDRPIIVGQLYNAVAMPPGLSERGGLPGNRYLSGLRSREIRGARGNQLCLDDTPGQIGAQLASDHAATQLNLGHLSTPRVDGAGQQRGDGFELRSDASGSLRTARSLLISSWKQLSAGGKQLDSSEHVALMKECLELFTSLGEYAAQHRALALDATGSEALLASAIAADKPVISITAPEGVAVSTPKTIAGHAGENIDLVALRQLQLSAGQHCNINAGKGISLFAHQDGIVQVAHHGKFLLQSQHDLLQADAAKEIRLTAGTRLVGMAQDEITFMTTGGAYLKLSGGAVELGGPGALTIKTDGHHWNGPGSMKAELPAFSEGDLGRVPQLVRANDGMPVEGVEVHVERENDSALTGRSDANGLGPRVLTDHLQRLKGFFFSRRS